MSITGQWLGGMLGDWVGDGDSGGSYANAACHIHSAGALSGSLSATMPMSAQPQVWAGPGHKRYEHALATANVVIDISLSAEASADFIEHFSEVASIDVSEHAASGFVSASAVVAVSASGASYGDEAWISGSISIAGVSLSGLVASSDWDSDAIADTEAIIVVSSDIDASYDRESDDEIAIVMAMAVRRGRLHNSKQAITYPYAIQNQRKVGQQGRVGRASAVQPVRLRGR